MRPRRERVRSFLSGLVKFVALVAVAGGCGVGIGYGLSTLSDEENPTAPVASAGSQTETTAPARPAPTATTPPPLTTATTRQPVISTATATTPAVTPKPAGAFAEVRVRVLGAILRPAGTADGRQRRRARLTMRVQAVNEADQAVTIGRPVVAVGKVRIGTDTAARTAEPQLGEIPAGQTKAATLRFELAGEATEKITIDRRARINIAGRSLPFRVTVGAPVTPPPTTRPALRARRRAPRPAPASYPVRNVMPRRERARLLLRGLAKLLAVAHRGGRGRGAARHRARRS